MKGTNLTVTGVSQLPGTSSALPLSDPIPGYALVSLDSSAFSDCTSLTSVTIPVSVTSNIRYYAFKGCSSLTSVYIQGDAPSSFSSTIFANTPDLGASRVNTVEGRASLTGNWQSPANATHRYFRVKVSMDIP
jgi:hypothetical protein